jgi:hypothetical protein
LFTLGNVLKIVEVAQKLDFSIPFTSCVLILTNTWLGYILRDFFTNSSGHPVRNHYREQLIFCTIGNKLLPKKNPEKIEKAIKVELKFSEKRSN